MAGCDDAARAKDLAYRYLALRARSRAEIEAYLKRKGVPEDAATGVVETLAGYGFIDDGEFTKSYSKYILEKKSLSRYALRMELRRKGVSDAHIEAALDALPEEEDEEAVAVRLAERKAASMKGLDKQKARQRLVGLLRRRGFSFDVINRVLRRLA